MIKLFTAIVAVLSFVGAVEGSEDAYLSNIRQLTFPEMGFLKAGEAYFSPDEKSIIFQAVPVGKSHYQMYIMGIEDMIPKMVSTGEGACTCGNFRPDGKKIIFASSHDSPIPVTTHTNSQGQYQWDFTPYMNIYEANTDGTDLKPLTSGPAYHAECAYSSDGKDIVYASNEDGSMNIYVMNSNGTNVRQLTHSCGCYNGGCFFSPDNKKIIFRADREKPHYLQLYLISADGTEECRITDNESVNWAPYWHPDGKHIAFTKSLEDPGRYEIFLLDIETGEELRITYDQSFNGLPVFNRDGTKLMWTSKRGLDGSCQIFIAEFKKL